MDRARAARLDHEAVVGGLDLMPARPSSVTTAAIRSVSWPRMKPTPRHPGGTVGEHRQRGEGLRHVGQVGQIDVDAVQRAGAVHLGGRSVWWTSPPSVRGHGRRRGRPGAIPAQTLDRTGPRSRGGREEVGGRGGIGLDRERWPGSRPAPRGSRHRPTRRLLPRPDGSPRAPKAAITPRSSAT